MKRLYLADIVHHIGGTVIQGSGNPVIHHVTKSLRKQQRSHTLYFHLDAKQIDDRYFRDKTSMVVVTAQPEKCSRLGDKVTVVKVGNCDKAYWKFVHYYRNLFHIPVIGITGTCGKTTTKEMIKHILSKDHKVHATNRSNNSWNLNLRYLLGIDDSTDFAVFEIPGGMRNYVKTGCKYFQPQIRLLLNIGVHHLVDCVTPEEYLKSKAEILDGLDPVHGSLILNADDNNIKKIDISKFKNVIYFGLGKGSHFRAQNVSYGRKGMKFTMRHRHKSYEVYVPGFGEHNVYNALAAIAAVSEAGFGIQKAIDRLATFTPVEEHLEFLDGANGCTVINDTWNNSPLSMSVALQVLKDVSKGRKKIALLGHMPQLGGNKYATKEYAKLGKKAVDANVDLLIVVGDEAREIGSKAVKLGMNKRKVYFCTTGTEVYDILRPHLNRKSVILLKITHRVMVKPSFSKLKKKLLGS